MIKYHRSCSIHSFQCIHLVSNCIYVQSDWPAPMPAIGRIANYSSLRKHRPMENQIYDSYFGQLDAAFYDILTLCRAYVDY